MNKDHTTFDATHTLWVMANYRLQVPSDDWGVWRRLRVLPFDFAKKESEYISGLFERIYAEEAPGILARWIATAGDFLSYGISTPKGIEAARDEYIKEQDTVSLWLEECATAEDPTKFTRYQALRENYLNWCKQEKKIAIGSRAFPLALKAHGFADEKKYVNDGADRRQVRGYIGIVLL
jgi:putative DNA primase/helicase